jgi:type IV secretory pathway VirB4 component
MELNEHGLKVWKHKTNKRLFLKQSYRWKDSLILLDETEERQIVDIFKASTFNYSSWIPMTQEEFDSVKSKFTEIYN